MEFIEILKCGRIEYHVFYSNINHMINLYFHNDKGETERSGLPYNKARILYDILTEENFIDNYISILNNVLSKDEKEIGDILECQTYSGRFWEDFVLTKFSGKNVIIYKGY